MSRVHDRRQAAGHPRLRLPAAGHRLREGQVGRRARRLLQQGRLVHRRRQQRLPAAHLPREPRHGPGVDVPQGRRAERGGAPQAGEVRQLADVHQPRQPGHLLRRRAGLRQHRWRPAGPRGHVRQQGRRRTTPRPCSAVRRARATGTTPRPRSTGTSPRSRPCAPSTRRSPTVRRSRATPPTVPASSPSRASARSPQKEYLVVANNSTTSKTVATFDDVDRRQGRCSSPCSAPTRTVKPHAGRHGHGDRARR